MSRRMKKVDIVDLYRRILAGGQYRASTTTVAIPCIADRQNCLLLLLGMRERAVVWASQLVFLEEGSELKVYDLILPELL